MTDVEYDSAAMKTALKELHQAIEALMGVTPGIKKLSGTSPPGQAGKTGEFQTRLGHCITASQNNHAAGHRQIVDAYNSLLAIDKEYNKGEVASELGFHKIKNGVD